MQPIYHTINDRVVQQLGNEWLPDDTFLPRFLPLLCNLKAFVLYYVSDWDLLCEGVRRSLQDLMRLPSLVFVELAPLPAVSLTECFGSNLKHLVIRDNDPPRTLVPPVSSSSPIYLETLLLAKANATFLTPLTSDPNFRFKTSCLRKLVLDIDTNKTFQHFALPQLLHSCHETLEEFTFRPRIESESSFIFIGPHSHPISSII